MNNNLIKRIRGAISERNKVMRGLNGEDSTEILIDGLRIYYKFLRSHMGTKQQYR